MPDSTIAPSLGWALSAYEPALPTILAILHWRRDKGRFAVSPDVLHMEFDPDKTIVWRLVEIVNVGRRPLYLEDFGILLTSGAEESMRGRESETEYPLKLDEGQKHRSMTVEDRFPSPDIRRLWARDTTGRMYYSGGYPFGKE